MTARADTHTVSALRREQAPCGVCEGTGRHWERHDYTGYPVKCDCPQCGGTGLHDEPATMVSRGRGPTLAEYMTEVADECPF